MAIRLDTSKPEYLTLDDVSALVPGNPGRTAVWSWMRRGCLSRTGERVRLKCYRAGRRLFTSKSLLDEFFTALADSDAPQWQTDAEGGAR